MDFEKQTISKKKQIEKLIGDVVSSHNKYLNSSNDFIDTKDQEVFQSSLDSMGLAKKTYEKSVWKLAELGEEYSIWKSQLNYMEMLN